ncbi:MAG: serine/threonine protein kinase [Phycisphaerales bacterium]|nr:MAG: serine/threonine protein kinase [Phycisphaerales bacterium]
MAQDNDKAHLGKIDEAEFEASLVAGETELIATRPVRRPPKKTPPQPAWAGKQLGHFKLLRLIGEGKMGRVIQARDINLQRLVALKVLCKRLPGIDATKRVDQFFREARAAAQIDHPNVVHIYEINQHDGWWYIAMEMIEGGNLREAIKAAGPLPAQKACAFIADAASALATAHELGILHRDIKPTNLMLTRQGRCKVTDFGLVHMDDPNDPFQFTHKAVGSPLFMAPELILRGEQTPALDVYSLGTTLFFALTGRAPFVGKTVQEVLKKHVKAPIPDLRTVMRDCSATLAVLVARALAKAPGDRPSAGDMAAALRAESIAGQMADSGTLSPGASSLIRELMGSGVTDTTVASQLVTFAERWAKSLRRRRQWVIGSVAVLATVLLLFGGYRLIGQLRGRRAAGSGSLMRYFPDAPANYGVADPDSRPFPVGPDVQNPPAFSWVGRINPGQFQFVASRSGRHFYPLDDPRSVLIRAEEVVGYRTPQAAQADGKTAAP